MWPWEHVMLAYVGYSAYAHLRYAQPPGDAAALVLPVAALLPDVIDKPLAWQLSVLPAGRSLGHTLVFAVPLVSVVLSMARARGRGEVGWAFGVAYLSHLPADAFYPAIMPGEDVDLGYLVWPFASVEPSGTQGFLARTLELVGDFSGFVAGANGWRFLVLEGLLVSLTFALWLVDGRPGLRAILRLVPSRPDA